MFVVPDIKSAAVKFAHQAFNVGFVSHLDARVQFPFRGALPSVNEPTTAEHAGDHTHGVRTAAKSEKENIVAGFVLSHKKLVEAFNVSL